MEKYVLIFEQAKKECGCKLYAGTSPAHLDQCTRVIKDEESKGSKLVTVLEVAEVVDLDRFADMIYELKEME